MSPEELAELEKFEMLACLQGPEELASQAAEALWRSVHTQIAAASDGPVDPEHPG